MGLKTDQPVRNLMFLDHEEKNVTS